MESVSRALAQQLSLCLGDKVSFLVGGLFMRWHIV